MCVTCLLLHVSEPEETCFGALAVSNFANSGLQLPYQSAWGMITLQWYNCWAVCCSGCFKNLHGAALALHAWSHPRPNTLPQPPGLQRVAKSPRCSCSAHNLPLQSPADCLWACVLPAKVTALLMAYPTRPAGRPAGRRD